MTLFTSHFRETANGRTDAVDVSGAHGHVPAVDAGVRTLAGGRTEADGVDVRVTWDAGAAVRHYGAASVACAVVSVVYEHFSHDVYSPFMVGMFAFPLLMGLVPALVAQRRGLRLPASAATLWCCAVMTLTVGSGITGVFEIYGSRSPLVVAYWMVGAALALAATVVLVASHLRRRTTASAH